MPTRHYIFASKAIHDLEYIVGLSDTPSRYLLVSDRTLYLLHNFAAHEVTNAEAYAVEFGRQFYRHVIETDDEWPLFLSVRDNAQLELMEGAMSGEIYGVASTVMLADTFTFSSAGGRTLTLGTVPAGEKWQVEAIASINRDNAPFSIAQWLTKGTDTIEWHKFSNPPGNTWQYWTGRVTLDGGDKLQVRFSGCSAGDTIDAIAWVIVLS